MIKKMGWSYLQKEKRKKEIRDRIKKFVKVAGYWIGLGLLACLVAPICWVLLVAILSI